jgi:putative membrane protein
MRAILIRLAVNAAALWVAALVVDDITFGQGSEEDGKFSQRLVMVLVVAAIFGLVNAFIKPVVKLLALPLFIVTLGLITFVINALMLLLTSGVADVMDVPFHVDGFGSALVGGLVISFVSFLINVVLPDELETH